MRQWVILPERPNITSVSRPTIIFNRKKRYSQAVLLLAVGGPAAQLKEAKTDFF
jgi:hypothetical protein